MKSDWICGGYVRGKIRVRSREGGEGSGYRNHPGNPGHVGGSVSEDMPTMHYTGKLYHATDDPNFKPMDDKGDGFLGKGLYLSEFAPSKNNAYGDHVHVFEAKDLKLLDFQGGDHEYEAAVNKFYKSNPDNYQTAFRNAMIAKGYDGLRVERGLPPHIVAGIVVLWKPTTSVKMLEGGEGSGFYDHPGRPGQVGGSSTTGETKIEVLKRAGIVHQNATNAPTDPATIAAYTALKEQTLKQYNDLIAKGYKFEYGPIDPYSTSTQMRNDVDARKTIAVYSDSSDLPPDHPLAEIAPNGQTYNTVFRGVHDLNGHYFPNHSFGPNGELGAFQAHSKMYDDKALPALAAETLAQNAWVNYGPHNPENLPFRDRPFAPQKAYAFPIDLAKKAANNEFSDV
jgi:hypothetical protein